MVYVWCCGFIAVTISFWLFIPRLVLVLSCSLPFVCPFLFVAITFFAHDFGQHFHCSTLGLLSLLLACTCQMLGAVCSMAYILLWICRPVFVGLFIAIYSSFPICCNIPSALCSFVPIHLLQSTRYHICVSGNLMLYFCSLRLPALSVSLLIQYISFVLPNLSPYATCISLRAEPLPLTLSSHVVVGLYSWQYIRLISICLYYLQYLWCFQIISCHIFVAQNLLAYEQHSLFSTISMALTTSAI